MTSTLEGGEWSSAHPGRTLPPGKTRYPLHRRLGGTQGRSGQVRKIWSPPGLDPQAVQPVLMNITCQLINKHKLTKTVLDKKFSTFRERFVYYFAHKKKTLVTTLKQVKHNLKRPIPIFHVSFNPLKTKRRLLYLKTQSVPRCKHFSSRLYNPISLCCKWHKSLFVLR
jgi:hypothetical protein